MKYNKVIVASLLAVAMVGCSTKRVQEDTVMVEVYKDTIVECSNIRAPGGYGSENIHYDSSRMSWSDCVHLNGVPAFYPNPINR